jgi:hypothetical protein
MPDVNDFYLVIGQLYFETRMLKAEIQAKNAESLERESAFKELEATLSLEKEKGRERERGG